MPAPLSHQSHRSIMAHIARLKADKKAGRLPKVNTMPDLSCSRPGVADPAPLTNAMPCKFSTRKGGAYHPDAKVFPSATLFKQGPQLITPGDIKSGAYKDYGGHKPNKGIYE